MILLVTIIVWDGFVWSKSRGSDSLKEDGSIKSLNSELDGYQKLDSTAQGWAFLDISDHCLIQWHPERFQRRRVSPAAPPEGPRRPRELFQTQSPTPSSAWFAWFCSSAMLPRFLAPFASVISEWARLDLCLKAAYGGFIYAYAEKNEQIEISSTTGAYLTASFWGSFALGRLLSIPISAVIASPIMLFLNLVC